MMYNKVIARRINNMSLANIIKDTCKKLNVTMVELSRRSNQSPQNLGKKINRESLGYEEFLELLKCLGVQYEYRLVFPDEEPDDLLNDRVRNKIDILENQISTQKKTIDYLNDINRDVRNGMNIIGGSVDLAKKHSKDEVIVTECIERIQKAKNQINNYLNDGIDLASISVGLSNENVLEGKRCLLAEDDALNREITKVSLEDCGIIVDEAINGKVAFEMAQRNTYDFILMDIVMPIMDGYEAARKIREKDKDVLIFAFSANAGEEEVLKSKAAGMNEHLSKPVSVDKIIDIVSKDL